MKKHVAYIFDTCIDVDSRAQKEIDTLASLGCELSVFEWNKDENYQLKAKEAVIRGRQLTIDSVGIKVKKTKGIKENFTKLVRYELVLFDWIRKNRKQFGIIHCVNLDTALVSVIQAKLLGKSVVYDIFDDYADAHSCRGRLYSLIKKVDYRVIKRSDCTIICSEKRRAQILHPTDNIVVIHNSPDIDLPVIAAPDRHEKTRVVYVGNLTTNRMIEDLLEIVSRHPEWELYCGGAGVLEDLVKQYAQKYENIFFHGKMKYEDVLDLEIRCDIIPAIYDPAQKNNQFAAPNKFYEAMYLGKPTIMVHNTGMDDVVEENRLGLTIDKNKEALESALQEIASDIERWRGERDRIHNLYKSRYDWKVMAKRLADVYEKL